MRTTRQEYIWVIEVWEGDRWEPCASAFLTREDARGYLGLQDWREKCPDDRFRVAKYKRASQAG